MGLNNRYTETTNSKIKCYSSRHVGDNRYNGQCLNSISHISYIRTIDFEINIHI